VPFLSPAKLLVILVVALIVLGPDKLPRVARQIGSFWGDLRSFRQRVEAEVRGTFPDLPSTDRIAHAVRSPLSFLDELADSHVAGRDTPAPDAPAPDGNGPGTGGTVTEPAPVDAAGATAPPPGPAEPGGSPVPVTGVVHQVRLSGATAPDDPSMN